MFCMLKKIIYPTHNSNQEKHVTLLIISSGEKLRHYLALKKLSPLSTGINISVNLIVFILLEKKTGLQRIKEYVKTKIFVM